MSARPTKILRVDWYASDFLAGMAGHPIGLDGWGAYIGIISICYAEARPSVPEDEAIERLASMSRCNPRTVRKGIEALVRAGKLTRTDGELEPKRVRMELERTLNRMRINIESGAKGGRPSKENKDLEKGLGLFSETLIPTPTPTPTPTVVPNGEGGTGGTARSRASRLPSDWTPSPKLEAWAIAERADLNLTDLIADFRDYWLAKPGQAGTKLNWDATFRRWVRHANAQRKSAKPNLADQRRADRVAVLNGLGIPMAAGGTDPGESGAGDQNDPAATARIVGTGRA